VGRTWAGVTRRKLAKLVMTWETAVVMRAAASMWLMNTVLQSEMMRTSMRFFAAHCSPGESNDPSASGRHCN